MRRSGPNQTDRPPPSCRHTVEVAAGDTTVGSGPIPTAVLFTCTSAAIRPRTLASIEVEFAANGVSVLKTRLHDREAFRALFSYGGTLANLDPSSVRNVPAAIKNAQAFAQEVVAVLRINRESAAA